MITVKIHTILEIKKIIGQREVEVSLPPGSTLNALLSKMVSTWGEALGRYLFDPQTSELFTHIRVMVNGQDIGFLDGLETVLNAGDEILVLPPVGGG